ncbi:MAG: molecular chaperone HtpG [Legionellales bacterium]|nr:molecular chaperone HtpG [Legionellales bacterium]
MTDQATTAKPRQFEAQVSQLLQLLAGALYKNKEIFFRELISNASDASDKLRFKSLSNSALAEHAEDLKIIITPDKANKTLTIEDRGIGMNETDLIENLGTIARSGTKEFLSQLDPAQSEQSQLIGQFGVGFYSAFVVSNSVEVLTLKAGEAQGYRWTSNGVDAYEIEPCDLTQVGTRVILHLKDDEHIFLESWRIREIVRRYSDHIALPIYLMEAAANDSPEEDQDTAQAPVLEETLINEAQALWRKPKKEITSEQYTALYQHIAHDSESPLCWAHHHVEGKLSYTSLLFIPEHRPFDLWSREHRSGLKLYVQRVFIMDDAEQFLPMYLRFVKGVIDSSDLPLNVSREVLQETPHTTVMRNACIKRVLDLLTDLANDEPERYQIFWDNFGAVLKEGPSEDPANKDRLMQLYRFNTTHCSDSKQTVSLNDYISRMQQDQKKIYYCTADSYEACQSSPHLEVFKANNIEVLFLFDRIDEWLVSHMGTYEDHAFQSVARGDLDFLDTGESNEATQNDSKDESDSTADLEPMLKRIESVLKDQVQTVRVSRRLTDSVACLVVGEHEMSTHLQRILKEAGQSVPTSQPILEINPNHPMMSVLEKETSEDQFAAWSQIIFDQATLSEGGQLVDSARYVKNIDQLLRLFSTTS